VQAFYRAYYHPSNARFWFYGDDPSSRRLELLGAALEGFEANPVDSAVTTQTLFKASSQPACQQRQEHLQQR
jgi:Zn-dependent M16 (insulinase) family peptidase